MTTRDFKTSAGNRKSPVRHFLISFLFLTTKHHKLSTVQEAPDNNSGHSQVVVGRARPNGRGTLGWVKVRDSGGPTLGWANVRVCGGTWGSLDGTRLARVWEPRSQGRGPSRHASICSPGRSGAPGGWAESCLQVYWCPGTHSPSCQLARRAEHIRTLNCRETEALHTGLATSQVRVSSSEPRDGLSCPCSGTQPRVPQGGPTFSM